MPYPVGNGEQEFNAAELVAAGAAALLRNQDCTESKLKLLIDSLLADQSKLDQMGKSAKAIARPAAAADIENASAQLAASTINGLAESGAPAI